MLVLQVPRSRYASWTVGRTGGDFLLQGRIAIPVGSVEVTRNPAFKEAMLL